MNKTAWALVAAGALLWALAIYGFTILALAGSAAWLAADKIRAEARPRR